MLESGRKWESGREWEKVLECARMFQNVLESRKNSLTSMKALLFAKLANIHMKSTLTINFVGTISRI